MTKREIIKMVLDGKKPPYVPWHFQFTIEALEKLEKHFGKDYENYLDNHMVWTSRRGMDRVRQSENNPDHYIDFFGVVLGQEY